MSRLSRFSSATIELERQAQSALDIPNNGEGGQQ
jgi:hypothetical protein